MSVTDFKAKCLEMFDRLDSRVLSSVTVTRRGKPVAEIKSPALRAEQLTPLHGCMRGTVIIPPDFDLTAPIFEDEFEAESGKFCR